MSGPSRRRRIPAGPAAALLVLASTPAIHAQRDAFVEGVRDLAAAAARPDTDELGPALDRMEAALAEWDRALAAFEAQVRGEASAAPPARAFQLRLDLGLRLLDRGRLADALDQFDALAALEPRRPDVALLKALALEAAGRPADAAAAFRAAWALDVDDPVKAYYVLHRGGDSPPAELDRARDVLTATYRRLLEGQGPPPGGAPFAVLGPIPDTLTPAPVVGADAWVPGFQLLLDRRYDAAIAALRRRLTGAGAEPEHSPRVRFARGREYEAGVRIAEARREYEAALAGTLVGRAPLYIGIGRLAQVEGDIDAAIDAFSRAVSLNPNDPLAHKELAAACAAAGRMDEAFRELVAALLIAPRDAHAFAAIGQMYIDAGRDADAVPALTRALELMPASYEPRYALATALTRLGRTEDAARELAIYERGRQEMLERRRRQMQDERDRAGARQGGAR
jgi:tetratricopeptide (TPR) repeat protein